MECLLVGARRAIGRLSTFDRVKNRCFASTRRTVRHCFVKIALMLHPGRCTPREHEEHSDADEHQSSFGAIRSRLGYARLISATVFAENCCILNFFGAKGAGFHWCL
jgi:hypothetical protein